jgi:hypothetical protein
MSTMKDMGHPPRPGPDHQTEVTALVARSMRPVGGVVARTNWRGCLEPSCELPLTRGCHMGYRHDSAHSHCDLLAGGPNGYNSRMALIANPNC